MDIKEILKTLEDQIDKRIESGIGRLKQVTSSTKDDICELAKNTKLILRKVFSRPHYELKVSEVGPEYTTAVDFLVREGYLWKRGNTYKPGSEFYMRTDPRLGCIARP